MREPGLASLRLTDAQADGRACVWCGEDYATSNKPQRPAGRSDTGSQTFACQGYCHTQVTRDVLDALRDYDPDTSSTHIIDAAIAEIERLRRELAQTRAEPTGLLAH